MADWRQYNLDEKQPNISQDKQVSQEQVPQRRLGFIERVDASINKTKIGLLKIDTTTKNKEPRRPGIIERVSQKLESDITTSLNHYLSGVNIEE